MIAPNAVVELHLDDEHVGNIVVERSHDSWTFGRFTPNDKFVSFAPRFGWWSLLMHEDCDRSLDRRTALELRRAEQALDSLHVRLRETDTGIWHTVWQINIDGPLAEWKEA